MGREGACGPGLKTEEKGGEEERNNSLLFGQNTTKNGIGGHETQV